MQDILKAYQGQIEELRLLYGEKAVRRLARATFPRLQDTKFDNPGQKPTFLHIPDLPSQPWWNRDQAGPALRLVNLLEENWRAIREEVVAYGGRREGYNHFTVEQAKIATWETVFLRKLNGYIWEVLEQFPTLARIFPHPCTASDEIFISILTPGTHIPPHHGALNYRPSIHIPLVVPEGTDLALRVGDEQRTWEEGRCMIFDDSYDHEAWNRTPNTRIVLILGFYHPDLSIEERMSLVYLHDFLSQAYNTLMATK
jgi:aspartate beta-hydroxylase